MDDQDSPILDSYDASRIELRPDFDYKLDYKLQLNSFSDDNSILGIFNLEPDPYVFFSVDSASVEVKEKLPQYDLNN